MINQEIGCNTSSAFATPDESRLEQALEITKSQLSERRKKDSTLQGAKRSNRFKEDALVKVAQNIMQERAGEFNDYDLINIPIKRTDMDCFDADTQNKDTIN